jgi:diguanylate cyclase (GGDEF)-like protein
MTAKTNPMADWRNESSGADDAPAADVVAVPALQRSKRPASPTGAPVVTRAAIEIHTLRSINARLIQEIALLRQREAHALRLADRDGLTGLYNRRRMSELLEEAIVDAARQGHQFGVLFIDLDGFKRINDAYGHAMGDELLNTVAGRIATRARTGDVVCRYGGDEFIVLLPRVPDRSAAYEVAATIASRVALPIKLGGEELRVTAAIGVSMYPEDGETAARLLERADELMYRAKASIDLPPDPALCLPPSRRRDDRTKRRGW